MSVLNDNYRLGERIKDLVAQGDEAKEKADQFYIAAGIHLRELREQKPEGVAWAEYAKEMTGLGKSRVYELIAIADGKTTLAETRERTAGRTQRAREAALERPLRSGQRNDNEELEEPTDEETLEQAFLIRAGEALRYAFYEGPKSKRVLTAARQTAQAWMNLASKLQGD